MTFEQERRRFHRLMHLARWVLLALTLGGIPVGLLINLTDQPWRSILTGAYILLVGAVIILALRWEQRMIQAIILDGTPLGPLYVALKPRSRLPLWLRRWW